MKSKLVCAQWGLWLALGAVSVRGDLIASDAADGTVSASSVIDTASFNAQAGTLVQQRAFIIPFLLPTLAFGEGFVDADFRDMLFGQNSTGFNADLYGLSRVNASSAIAASDFFIGALDATATLIQDNFFTPTSPGLGTPVNTDATGDLGLTAWLNVQYAGGANAGNYVFLRLNADDLPTGDNRYDILTQDAGGATEKPLITYTAGIVPEPSTLIMGIVGLGIVWCTKRRMQ